MISGPYQEPLVSFTQYIVTGAQVLIDRGLCDTNVTVVDGIIAEIGTSQSKLPEIDGRGHLLLPGIVDIHGDAFERQLMPRPNVFFPMDAALLDTDRQLGANGITTAYHALTLSWEPGLRSVERGCEFLKGLESVRPRMTIENRVQLRWETFAFEAIELVESVLAQDMTPSLAFNDHTSMSMRSADVSIQNRLFEHNPEFAIADFRCGEFAQRHESKAIRAGMSVTDYTRQLIEVWSRRDEVPVRIAELALKASAAGVPLLSHDDTQLETRDFYRSLGAGIAEFPMRADVAAAACTAGDFIVFGAPNAVRGGSQIGSPGAADMVEQGLCDILASDYFYPAMLAAIARLHRERRASFATLWSLVSRNPAKAMQLDDRGVIEVGKRADLILIDWPKQGTPVVRRTISRGRIAVSTNCAGMNFAC